jgi:hypothetical protein
MPRKRYTVQGFWEYLDNLSPEDRTEVLQEIVGPLVGPIVEKVKAIVEEVRVLAKQREVVPDLGPVPDWMQRMQAYLYPDGVPAEEENKRLRELVKKHTTTIAHLVKSRSRGRQTQMQRREELKRLVDNLRARGRDDEEIEEILNTEHSNLLPTRNGRKINWKRSVKRKR